MLVYYSAGVVSEHCTIFGRGCIHPPGFGPTALQLDFNLILISTDFTCRAHTHVYKQKNTSTTHRIRFVQTPMMLIKA